MGGNESFKHVGVGLVKREKSWGGGRKRVREKPREKRAWI